MFQRNATRQLPTGHRSSAHMRSCRLVRLASPGETWPGDIFCRLSWWPASTPDSQQETAVIQTSSAAPALFMPQHSGDSFVLMSGICLSAQPIDATGRKYAFCRRYSSLSQERPVPTSNLPFNVFMNTDCDGVTNGDNRPTTDL